MFIELGRAPCPLRFSIHGSLVRKHYGEQIEDQLTCEVTLAVNLSVDPGSVAYPSKQSFPSESGRNSFIEVSDESDTVNWDIRAKAFRIVAEHAHDDDQPLQFPGLETSVNC